MRIEIIMLDLHLNVILGKYAQNWQIFASWIAEKEYCNFLYIDVFATIAVYWVWDSELKPW